MRQAGDRRVMSRAVAPLVAVLVGLLPAGCAYVTAVPVKPGDKIAGIRVYDVKPLLVVSGESTEIKLVPNYNRAYALQFGAFLARNNFKAVMEGGILTQIDADLDPTEFVRLLGKIVDKVPIPGKSLSGDGRTAGGVQDRFQVYDIVFDNDGNLVGLKPLIFTDDLRPLKTAQVVPPSQTVPQGGTGAVNTGPVSDGT
jgi:hypothetical protein